MIFDTKMPGEFDGYVTCNYPVIRKACIQRHSQQQQHHQRDSDEITATAASSGNNNALEIYSINWIMFLPNIIIDAKLGFFLYLELNLHEVDLRIFREIKDDHLNLVEFLLNRRFTKRHVIKACQSAIEQRVSLQVIGQIFNKINELYKNYLILINNLGNQSPSSSSLEPSASQQTSTTAADSVGELENAQLKNLAIIEQYDMHNDILYPLVESHDERWWQANAKYTIAVLIEYFRSLNWQHIQIEHLLYKLLVNALIKCNRQQQLHQYLQYIIFFKFCSI
jgi:hypothetical protein